MCLYLVVPTILSFHSKKRADLSSLVSSAAFWQPRRTTRRTRHPEHVCRRHTYPHDCLARWYRYHQHYHEPCRRARRHPRPSRRHRHHARLRDEYFDDPADLARLPAVSRAMRDEVAVTGLTFTELGEYVAAELGCLRALRRLQRRNHLMRQERLCEAPAGGGLFEELKALRRNGTPWDTSTCAAAARGGHLKIRQWARANGCP